MPINVTTQNEKIEVSTSGQTVSATVSGGQGPQGPAGEAGAGDWDELTNVPATFPPQAHAATHGEDGADPLTLSVSQVDGLEDALDGKLPLAGGAMDASATITLSDATTDSEVAGWGFGVQVTEDASQYAYVEAGGFYVHGGGSSTTITPAGVTLHNATQLVKGSFDNNTGGANGISMICAVGYELNWQGGRLRNVQISGNGTPQPIYSDSSIIFSGEGVANVEIGSGGLTFSDSSTQTVAWPGTLSYDDLDDLPTLFDGSYASLTNVPSTFEPTSHGHGAADITIEDDDGDYSTTLGDTAVQTFLYNISAYSQVGNGAGTAAARLAYARTILGLGYGTSATTVCVGNDSRLSNARTPTAHKSTHAIGGTDALTASDIGAAASSHAHAASDITTGTVATARLGSGTANSTTYLRGDGQWSAVSGESFHPFLLAGM
jgi:hypothetical protein